MTLEAQYKQFLKHNPDSTFSFNEWMKWHSHQMEQAIIQMMQDDEELGLYDYDWCKGNVVLPREEIKLEDVFNDDKKENIKKFIDEIKNPSQPNRALKDAAQRLEKYSERFNNKNNQIVEGIFNPDTWGKRLVEEKNPYIGPFLLRNGFKGSGGDTYHNPKCTITVLEDCYQINFNYPEGGKVSAYTDSHSIPHLVGVLTWNDLIDKNYKK